MPINCGLTAQNVKPPAKQSGIVMVLMMFLIGLAVSAYLIKSLNVANLQARQDVKTMQTLGEAKAALIAWSVSHPNTPGQMPWPDRNTDTDFDGVSAYDGKSDCVTTAFQYSYLLGQLPWKTQSNPCVTPHIGLGQDFRDAQGNHLWYAVSRNLVYDYVNSEDPIINPDMINPPHAITPYMRQSGTQSYPWLRVLDRNGNLVSDRVAAVIIAPGNPIGGQNRSASAPNASEFLDSFRIGAAIYSNRAYTTANEDFVLGEDGRNVLASDSTFQKSYYFNDKLVFITIDELMFALEKRAAQEANSQLKNYYAKSAYYPYAAKMGGSKNYSCVVGKLAGALPIAASHSSSCTYVGVSASSSNSACNFSEIESIIFTKTSLNFTSSTGACEFSGKVCTCNGLGECARDSGSGLQKFTCDADGVCSANMAGNYKFTGGAFDNVTGKCSSTCGSDITCSGTGSGAFAHSSCTDNPFNDSTTNSKLPTWFTYNLWQDYLYYAVQRGPSPTLTAGGRSGIKALIITTGYPIITAPFASKGSAQIRPSCNLIDQMDTNINAIGDVTNIYESVDKHLSQNYNDQIFVISP